MVDIDSVRPHSRSKKTFPYSPGDVFYVPDFKEDWKFIAEHLYEDDEDTYLQFEVMNGEYMGSIIDYYNAKEFLNSLSQGIIK